MSNDQNKTEKPLTLLDLHALKGVVAVRRLAIMANMDPVDLRKRMRVGSPELSADESSSIRDVLLIHHLLYFDVAGEDLERGLGLFRLRQKLAQRVKEGSL